MKLFDIDGNLKDEDGNKFEDLLHDCITDHGYEFQVEGFRVELNEVDSYGGEGCGDEYWIVFEVKVNGEFDGYIQANGHYSSYEGVYWDGMEPFEVVKDTKVVEYWRGK